MGLLSPWRLGHCRSVACHGTILHQRDCRQGGSSSWLRTPFAGRQFSFGDLYDKSNIAKELLTSLGCTVLALGGDALKSACRFGAVTRRLDHSSHEIFLSAGWRAKGFSQQLVPIGGRSCYCLGQKQPQQDPHHPQESDWKGTEKAAAASKLPGDGQDTS